MKSLLGYRHWRLVSSFILCSLLFIINHTGLQTVSADDLKQLTPIKTLGFRDPNTAYAYRITSYNATSLQATAFQKPQHWSLIKVARVRLDNANLTPVSDFEHIQTIKFRPLLVDFDLNCLPAYCYLVAVTSASKRNIELYAWHRTQLDLLARRDSFARPNAVKLFNVGTSFYVAVAQEQLHLTPVWASSQVNEYEEPTRFIGCAILKFIKGQEKNIKYHQFIKLPYAPLSVAHFVSINTINNHTLVTRSTENHFVVFSAEPHWHETSSLRAHTFIWSALDDHFWPFRLPKGIIIDRPTNKPHIIQFPSQPLVPSVPVLNQTTNMHHDIVEPVESCFNQLQRIITDRELYARRLIYSSASIWRSPRYNGDGLLRPRPPGVGLSNISAQVIVHGNVIVRGQIIESPQVSLIGAKPTVTWNQIANVVNAHSPAIVDNKLKQAFFKLNHIRSKLARAVPFNSLSKVLTQVDSRVRFFGTIHADLVEFVNGISNSNVKLNSIPFRQLEHELVSLRGAQDIAAKVMFKGNVVADLLEIHSKINGHYFIKNAVDILSRQVQVIDSVSTAIGPGRIGLDFYSLTANDLVLSPETKFNHVLLGDFITKNNRTQLVFGRKFFSKLSMGQLDMGNPNANLNGFNINKLATESIRLRITDERFRQFMHGQQTFLNNVIANRLVINHLVNGRINVTSLIHDTVKTFDAGLQLISGHKHFMQGLKINHLTTQGSLNGIQIDQVLNLNSMPPVSDFFKYSNISSLHHSMELAHPITGFIVFKRPVTILGNLNTATVNGVDVARRAVRRFPSNSQQANIPQIVYGRKQFIRPLHVVNKVHMISLQHNNNTLRPPTPSLINGFDLSIIKSKLNKLISKPQLITIENLIIDGNLYLPTDWNRNTAPKTTFGSFANCPLDLIQRKLILSGSVDQQLDVPIYINSLRVRSAQLAHGALNGMSFPQDFVLRSPINGQLEPIYGHKIFDHFEVNTIPLPPTSPFEALSNGPSILFDKAATINNVSFVELQTFINSERKRNFTGEIVYHTINLFGNIRAKRINGNRWPDDILLKSIGSIPGPVPSPYLHKRIYSPLVFLNTSHLTVENQLVLRGPVQLNGYLNGINVTEFSRNAATYGDKDLLASGRPIRNKIFAGGLTVTNEIRSRGLIDNVNFHEMRRRVVTIGPSVLHQMVTSQKVFMSDLNFLGPVNVNFLGDLPLAQHLKRIQFQADNRIHVIGRKTITGTLKINGDLIVQGKINGIEDFVDLKAKSISVASTNDILQFNKTLVLGGDVFMDNLLIDEQHGEIDGVKLASLVPLRNLARRQPTSIHYEGIKPIKNLVQHVHTQLSKEHSNLIKNQFLRLDHIHRRIDLIVGFVNSYSHDVSKFKLAEDLSIHSGHTVNMESFLVLDEIDYLFRPTTYHMSVGFFTNRPNNKEAVVYATVGPSPAKKMSELPLESPNNAMFLPDSTGSLFLLVSQDFTKQSSFGGQCPLYHSKQSTAIINWSRSNMDHNVNYLLKGGVHVYLFHTLTNSSLYDNAYFDLYQTIDLPAIDSFANFRYRGSTYALAISQLYNQVYLLLLRGYSGFQVVSYFHVPLIEEVKVFYTLNNEPVLQIYQKNGQRLLMDSVIV